MVALSLADAPLDPTQPAPGTPTPDTPTTAQPAPSSSGALRPAVHPTTERLYAELGPALRDGDDAGGWVMLRWLEAAGRLLGAVDDIVRDSDAGPGRWRRELNPATTSRPYWLAQFLGARLPAGLPLEQARARLLDQSAAYRGSPDSLVAAARPLLTGSRRVDVLERDGGSPYRVRVLTYSEQTPDAAAVDAALQAAKLAEHVLVHNVVSLASYGAVEPGALTYGAVEPSARTYAEAEARSGATAPPPAQTVPSAETYPGADLFPTA